MKMEHIEKVDGGIYSIDQRFTGHLKYNSCYLIEGDTVALFDSGPATVIDNVLDSARGLGYSPEDISYLIFSHIHIDHIGGAGVLCRDHPHLKVMVHEKGVPHLVNPEKLYQSMKKVFGDMADQMYGDIIPIPEDRIHPLEDGEIIELGENRRLRVLHTPGHASHHLSLYDESHRVLFAGEALGIYLPDADVYFPSTPPPEFDLVSAVESVEKLERLELEKVLFSHFGPARDALTPIKRSREMLIEWGRIIYKAMGESDDRSYIMDRLSEESMKCIDHLKDDAEMYAQYAELVKFRSGTTCGPGYIRYFNKGGKVL